MPKTGTAENIRRVTGSLINEDEESNMSRIGSRGVRGGAKGGSKDGSKDGSRGSKGSKGSRRSRSKSKDKSFQVRVITDLSQIPDADKTTKAVTTDTDKQNMPKQVKRTRPPKTMPVQAKPEPEPEPEPEVEQDATSDDTNGTNNTQTGETGDADAEVDAVVDADAVKIVETKYDTQYKRLVEIEAEIMKLERERRLVVRKMNTAHKSDLSKASRKKKKGGNGGGGGFIKQKKQIGGKLAAFFGVDDGTELTSPEIVVKFWEVMRSKNLIDKKDGRMFKVNKEIMDVFNLPDAAKKAKTATDHSGFNLLTYQKHIYYALKHNNGEYGEEDAVV